MKYLIASDIHGSAFYCEQLIEQFNNQGADKLLLLGDILYHGPRNELPLGYEPKKVIEMLNSISDKIFCVRGNCDCEVDQMVLKFPIMAEYAMIPYKDKTIFVTHGHKYGIDAVEKYYRELAAYNKAQENGEIATMPAPIPALNPGDVLLQGHTHESACYTMGCGIVYINPGSVSIPKGYSSCGYLTYEDGVFTGYTLDGDPDGMRYDMNPIVEAPVAETESVNETETVKVGFDTLVETSSEDTAE